MTDRVEQLRALTGQPAPSRVEQLRALVSEDAPRASAAPVDMFPNPATGQMTSRELLRNAYEGRGTANAVVQGAAQGGTFRYADELAGLAGALRYGADGRRYATEKARAVSEAAQADRSIAYTAGEVAGAINSTLPTAKLAVGPTLGSTAARSGGMGLLEGALYGSGRGETAGERVGYAVSDGLLSMIIGGAAPYAIEGGRRVVGALPRMLDEGYANWSNRNRANRALARTVHKARMTPQDVLDRVNRAHALGVTDYTPADAMGDAGARRLSGIARSTDDVASEVKTFLEERAADAPYRVVDYVKDAFETGGDTAEQRLAALEEARKARARQLGQAVRANADPVDVSGVVQFIDDSLGNLPDAAERLGPASQAVMDIRRRLATSNARVLDFNAVYDVFEDLSDEINTLFRQGKDRQASRLLGLKAELTNAMENASEGFKAMNAELSEMHRLEDALKTGQQLSSGTRNPADNAARFQALTPDQQAQARVGYADGPVNRVLNNRAEMPDVTREFLRPRSRQDIANIAVDGDGLLARLQFERDMVKTRNTATDGSPTARAMQDLNESAESAAGLIQGARNAMNLNLGDAVANVANALSNRALGINDATRTMIARSLLSGDPEQVIRAIETSEMSRTARLGLLTALARGGARPVTADTQGPQ